MLQNIAQMLNWLAGTEYLYFDAPLVVKRTPHTPPFNAWAACVSPEGSVYVMDAEEGWHQLEENQDSMLLIASLHQRLRYIVQKRQTKKEVEL